MTLGKEVKYWLLISLLSYVPTVALHIVVRPMWNKGIDSHTTATTIETACTVFIIPFYLLLLHFLLAKKYIKSTSSFLVNSFIILSCVWLSAFLHFNNWATTIGDKNNVDNDTMEVIGFERTMGYIISIIGIVITFFLLKRRNAKL